MDPLRTITFTALRNGRVIHNPSMHEPVKKGANSRAVAIIVIYSVHDGVRVVADALYTVHNIGIYDTCIYSFGKMPMEGCDHVRGCICLD